MRTVASVSRLAPVLAVTALSVLLPARAPAQQLIVLPTVTGETPLQQAIGNAVATMCVQALDGRGQTLQGLQFDLHDQCHAIAGADIGAATGKGPAANAGAVALAALQQVSGNEIAAQGALATRVSAGQFANIAGRLNVLRFGAYSVVSPGRVADGAADAGSTLLASAGPRSFYVDRASFDPVSRGDGFAPTLAPPMGARSVGTLSNTAFLSDTTAVRVAQASTGAASTSSTAAAPISGPANPWGAFLQGSYNSGHHDQTINEDQFDFHATSITGGIDYNFGQAVVGAAVGYDDYNAGFGNVGLLVNGGSARVQGTSGSVYGAWYGQHWSFSGIATYGHLSTTLSRNVVYTVTYQNGFDTQADIKDNCSGTTCTASVDTNLRGDPSGHTVAVGATAGYQLNQAGWDLLPSLSINYRRASFGAFNEFDPNPNDKGAGLALAFNDQSIESLRSILGLDISRPVSTTFGVVTPMIRGEWNHEFKTGLHTIGSHYVYDPTAGTTCLSCFQLPTDATPGNYGIAGAGVSVTLPHRIQAFVYDEVLFGFANYRSNSVAFGARIQL